MSWFCEQNLTPENTSKIVQYWLLNLKFQIKAVLGHFVCVLLTLHVVNEQDYLNSTEKNTNLVYKADFLGNLVNKKCQFKIYCVILE